MESAQSRFEDDVGLLSRRIESLKDWLRPGRHGEVSRISSKLSLLNALRELNLIATDYEPGVFFRSPTHFNLDKVAQSLFDADIQQLLHRITVFRRLWLTGFYSGFGQNVPLVSVYHLCRKLESIIPEERPVGLHSSDYKTNSPYDTPIEVKQYDPFANNHISNGRNSPETVASLSKQSHSNINIHATNDNPKGNVPNSQRFCSKRSGKASHLDRLTPEMMDQIIFQLNPVDRNNLFLSGGRISDAIYRIQVFYFPDTEGLWRLKLIDENAQRRLKWERAETFTGAFRIPRILVWCAGDYDEKQVIDAESVAYRLDAMGLVAKGVRYIEVHRSPRNISLGPFVTVRLEEFSQLRRVTMIYCAWSKIYA